MIPTSYLLLNKIMFQNQRYVSGQVRNKYVLSILHLGMFCRKSYRSVRTNQNSTLLFIGFSQFRLMIVRIVNIISSIYMLV